MKRYLIKEKVYFDFLTHNDSYTAYLLPEDNKEILFGGGSIYILHPDGTKQYCHSSNQLIKHYQDQGLIEEIKE